MSAAWDARVALASGLVAAVGAIGALLPARLDADKPSRPVIRLPGGSLTAAEKIERTGNRWALLFAASYPTYCDYMTEPACERESSPALHRSFRGATVEDIAIDGSRAAARFSNGRTVVLVHQDGFRVGGVWWVARVRGHADWSQGRGAVQGMGMSPVSDDAPDETLLAATRTEPAAFGAFYRRHEDRVLGYFLARVGDPEVAADLTAETFAAALVSAHRFRPRKKKPAAAWLFGIARNQLAMSRRQGRVEARARRRLGMAPVVLTDEAIERITELDRTALALVEDLPGDQREAVRARVIDERDYPEIAKDLRCSEAVVRKRVSRGLAAVRQRMGPR
jgi:RNA polymerase sigma-70 factor (ECF subfamily)